VAKSESGNITTLTGAEVNSRLGDLKLWDAASPLAANDSEMSHPITKSWNPTSLNSDSCFVADTFLVCSGKENITTVNFSNVTVGNVSYPGNPAARLSTTFIKALKPNYSYSLKITFTRNPSDPDQITSGDFYVGAFWRANETGERIIRIQPSGAGIPSTPTQWVASVSWWDSEWDPAESDGILLSKDKLDDTSLTARGIGTANPDPAESHKITTGYTSINGSASSTEPILFRIGLQQAYAAGVSDPNTHPARYAVVQIWFGGKGYKLFLRQGEGDDFAPSQSDGARWSPYNLGTLNNFVDYPTKAGYFYQWGYSAVSTPIPYHPVDPLTIPSGWSNTSTGAVYTLENACPTSKSYMLPSGGVSDMDFNTILFTSTTVGSVKGYYADGWFDRRAIVSSATGNENTTVSYYTPDDPRNTDVAYAGRLFYNTSSNTSLFFPFAGVREYNTNGKLTNAGVYGGYWSRTAGSMDGAEHMYTSYST